MHPCSVTLTHGTSTVHASAFTRDRETPAEALRARLHFRALQDALQMFAPPW